MISIGLISSSRADFGYYRPLLDRFLKDENIELRLIVTGAHLAEKYGYSVSEIESAGYEIFERVDSYTGDDTPGEIALNMSRGISGFASLFSRWSPDLLIVFGDRHDMVPAALTALPFQIPVAHISGGEVTEGAMDDGLRHAMTKLSHLHFVSTSEYADRIRQMGEEEDRVVVSGSLAIDAILNTNPISVEVLSRELEYDFSNRFALVTFHAVTLESESSEQYVRNLLLAVGELTERTGINAVFTSPNPDTSSSVILAAIQRFCSVRKSAHLVMNAGSARYFSLMREAELMIGNSSSGIAEAPSFGLPVVNVGTRQKGRIRAMNVIDCGYEIDEIFTAIDHALSTEFRDSLVGMESPFGTGVAAELITRKIKSINDLPGLIKKKFAPPDHDRMNNGGEC